MTIQASNIVFRLTPSGNSDPVLSLGGSAGGSQISAALHGLFDAVSPAEALAGDVEYRALDVKNTSNIDTLYAAVIYVDTITSGASDEIALAYDATGTQTIANENTAPIGLTFSAPTTAATGIVLGDIAPLATKRIWAKWTVTAGAGTVTTSGSITVAGGTA